MGVLCAAVAVSAAEVAQTDEKSNSHHLPLTNFNSKFQNSSPTKTLANLTTATKSHKPPPEIKWITSNDLIELISYLSEQQKLLAPRKSYIIIDTRNSNEYNGWKAFAKMSLRTGGGGNNPDDKSAPPPPPPPARINDGLISLYDTKNGHITDSHNFDADWLSFFEPKSLNSLVESRVGLRSKTPPPSKINQQNNNNNNKSLEQTMPLTVVLYDTRKTRLERVQTYLVENFVLDLVYLCQVETRDMSEFVLKANHSGNLFFQEPFYDMLLSADALFNILRPFSRPENRVVDVRPIVAYKLFDLSQSSSEKHYERSHVPTAVHFNTAELELSSGSRISRKNRTELARVLLDYGIAPNNTEMIILYGNPDPMAAYRAALLFKWMGVREIHVLNGGFRAWLTRNYPLVRFILFLKFFLSFLVLEVTICIKKILN